jgi:hypothetical protein
MYCPLSIKLKNHSAFIALWCLLLWGCKPTSKANESLPQIKDFIVDSIYLPLAESNRPNMRIKEIQQVDSSQKLVAFVRENNFKIYSYDFANNIYIDSFDISKYKGGFIDFVPIKADSFLIEMEDNTIIAISKRGKKEWHLNFMTQQLGKYACLGYQSAEPLHVLGDTLMITTSTNEYDTTSNHPSSIYLKAENDVIFRLLPDSAAFITMHNPNPSYYYKQDYYGSVEEIFLNAHSAVYSFTPSDTMLLYNFQDGTEKKTILKTNNFFKNRPFDYSKLQDFGYTLQYLAEQSRLGIGTLFYNRNKHQIYQLLQHKGIYIDSNGRKQGIEDAAQSLFVLDENLNQLKEVFMPPNSASSLYYYFIANSSIYIGAPKSKQKYHDKMLFYRIVFN